MSSICCFFWVSAIIYPSMCLCVYAPMCPCTYVSIEKPRNKKEANPQDFSCRSSPPFRSAPYILNHIHTIPFLSSLGFFWLGLIRLLVLVMSMPLAEMSVFARVIFADANFAPAWFRRIVFTGPEFPAMGSALTLRYFVRLFHHFAPLSSACSIIGR